MGFQLINSFTPKIEQLRIIDIYSTLNQGETTKIPFWVWLLENPQSPLPMPGKISLDNHDYLHILLGRDLTPRDEAFVVGFTMGNDPETKWYHVFIFKLFSYLIYPKLYQLNYQQMKIFDLGFMYGKKINYEKINTIDFTRYHNCTLAKLRRLFGIKFKDIELIRNIETFLDY